MTSLKQYGQAIWMIMKEIILPLGIALSINFVFPIFSFIEWLGLSMAQIRWDVISAPMSYIGRFF